VIIRLSLLPSKETGVLVSLDGSLSYPEDNTLHYKIRVHLPKEEFSMGSLTHKGNKSINPSVASQ